MSLKSRGITVLRNTGHTEIGLHPWFCLWKGICLQTQRSFWLLGPTETAVSDVLLFFTWGTWLSLMNAANTTVCVKIGNVILFTFLPCHSVQISISICKYNIQMSSSVFFTSLQRKAYHTNVMGWSFSHFLGRYMHQRPNYSTETRKKFNFHWTSFYILSSYFFVLSGLFKMCSKINLDIIFTCKEFTHGVHFSVSSSQADREMERHVWLILERNTKSCSVCVAF